MRFLGLTPPVEVTLDCLEERSRFIFGPIESNTSAMSYPVSENACLSFGVYTSTETSYLAWVFPGFFDFTTALISSMSGYTLHNSSESFSNFIFASLASTGSSGRPTI